MCESFASEDEHTSTIQVIPKHVRLFEMWPVVPKNQTPPQENQKMIMELLAEHVDGQQLAELSEFLREKELYARQEQRECDQKILAIRKRLNDLKVKKYWRLMFLLTNTKFFMFF